MHPVASDISRVLRVACMIICTASSAGCSSSREIPAAAVQPPENAGAPEPTSASDDCSPYTPGRVFHLAPEVIRYCGLLDQSGYTAFKASLSGTVTTLVITSAGGDGSYSVYIAEIVRDRKLNIEIAGPCFSGCASFIFVAGEGRTIAATGILGFHNTGSSAALMAEHSGHAFAPEDMAPLWARAAREWRLYASRGAGLELLFEPQARISTLCLTAREGRARTGEPIFDLVSEYELWIPQPDQLVTHGISFKGSLPRNLEEAERRFRDYMAPGSPVPRFVQNIAPLEQDAEHTLYRVRSCSG